MSDRDFYPEKKIKELFQFHNDKYPVESQQKGAYSVLKTCQGPIDTWKGEASAATGNRKTTATSRPRSKPTQMATKDKT